MNIEELAKKERREYYRQWREKNRERIRETNRRYWEKRAAKRQEQEGAD